ncbi:malonyl-CoA decarboxylase [Halomonas sp. PAMB 3264]|uniref:malonyl-CoA decarboxylase n=1 Tax=Halomonas sp. PAMB 3264 TaxID=3075222 RepID=UPI0028A27462|nr:malonyl-CoA decarboxylase [Halomonas sp. PAMB 3264]WNL42034.1 malonyl-CoA decarboxylase [Halomonas sp. PAMB 3264]
MNTNMTFLQGLLTNISSRTRQLSSALGTDKESENHFTALKAACQGLMGRTGEASQILMAQQALAHYRALDDEEKLAFFQLLANDYAAEPADIHSAYAVYREHEDNASLEKLFNACEPRRQTLLRRLNLCPGGTFDLVNMRADLLKCLRQSPELSALDSDFAHLFNSWFNRGFLMLESIDWNTPAAVLEKIIRYEAVHEIGDWHDLRRRLDPDDRRCYAFFHPATGDEPLIFVEVALCDGIPGNVQRILEHGEELPLEDADTAVFYSISNCQAGLKGVSFGNFLIKQVVQELSRELPQIKNFVTLSPVPGFADWLDEARKEATLSEELTAYLDTHESEELSSSAHKEFMRLASHYLVDVKHKSGQPLNPVARFHLGNGASLHRLNWRADTSSKGLKQAHGLMVNYLYQLNRIEQNHEAYSANHTVVCASDIRRQANQASQYFETKTPAKA